MTYTSIQLTKDNIVMNNIWYYLYDKIHRLSVLCRVQIDDGAVEPPTSTFKTHYFS